MTTTQIGPREAAAELVARLESLDWRFSLSDDGDLNVIIGDDPPRIPQPIVMQILWSLRDEVKALLAEQAIIH